MTNINSKSVSADQVVRTAGGWESVAREFGISGQAVRKWCAKNKVPSERVHRLCELTGFKIKPYQVRPDIFPEPAKTGAA